MVVISIIIGVIGGVVAGMGMGGGTFLIPLLIIISNFSQLQAQTINLISFLPMAIISLIIHFKNGYVDFKKVWFIALIGVGGAVCGGFVASVISPSTLKSFFGAFLIVLGALQFAKNVIKK